MNGKGTTNCHFVTPWDMCIAMETAPQNGKVLHGIQHVNRIATFMWV